MLINFSPKIKLLKDNNAHLTHWDRETTSCNNNNNNNYYYYYYCKYLYGWKRQLWTCSCTNWAGTMVWLSYWAFDVGVCLYTSPTTLIIAHSAVNADAAFTENTELITQPSHAFPNSGIFVLFITT